MFAFVLMCSESRSLVILRACRFFGSTAPSFSDQQLEYAVESCVDALDALAHEHRYRGQLRLSENKNILVFEMRQTQVHFRRSREKWNIELLVYLHFPRQI